MFDEFKKFLLRGNVVDLAVAVVIGAAFGQVVTVPRPRTSSTRSSAWSAARTSATSSSRSSTPPRRHPTSSSATAIVISAVINFVLVAAAIFFLDRQAPERAGRAPQAGRGGRGGRPADRGRAPHRDPRPARRPQVGHQIRLDAILRWRRAPRLGPPATAAVGSRSQTSGSVEEHTLHVVVVGCGRVGSGLARILEEQRAHRRRHRQAAEGLPPPARGLRRQDHRRASASTATGCREAGIEEAGALAAVTSGDNSNILVARAATEIFGIERVVARIYDPRRAAIYERLGIPTIATVQWTTDRVLRRILPDAPATEWIDPTRQGRASSSGPSPSGWAGRRLGDLDIPGVARVVALIPPRRRPACPDPTWSPRRATSSTWPSRGDHIAELRRAPGRPATEATDAGRHRRRRQRRHVHRRRARPGRPRGHRSSRSTPIGSPRPRRSASRPASRGSWPTRARSTSCARADLDQADVVAAVTGDDEDNLVISLLAKQEFAVPRGRRPGEQPEERVDVQRDVGRRRVGVHPSPAHRARRGGGLGRHARAAAVVRGRPGPPLRGHPDRRVAQAADKNIAELGFPRDSTVVADHPRRPRHRPPRRHPRCTPATRCSCWSRPTARSPSRRSSPARIEAPAIPPGG